MNISETSPESRSMPEHFNRYAAGIGAFCFLAIWKLPIVFVQPRFWAEESEYYHQMRHLGGIGVFTFAMRSNYQFLTNVIAYAATWAPVADAPLVTTWLSFFVAIATAGLLVRLTIEWGASALVAVLICAAWALLPQTYETFATDTNVQWICAASMFVMLALRLDNLVPAALAWAIVCGLTGVPSCILAPGFFLIAYIRKSRVHALIGGILFLCAAVQIALIIFMPWTVGNARPFPLGFVRLLYPSLMQGILGLFIGSDGSGALGALIRANNYSVVIIVPVICAGLICLILYLASANLERLKLSSAIFGTGIFAGVVQTFGMIGDPMYSLGSFGGGRYFIVVSVAVLSAFGICAAERPRFAYALLAIIIWAGIAQSQLDQWSLFDHGPNWRQEVAKCPSHGRCLLKTWAGGGIYLNFTKG